jgi:hypothetical protein
MLANSIREAIMLERRQNARARAIYSGVIAYNDRASTVDCGVRNFAEDSVKVEFNNTGRSFDRGKPPDPARLGAARLPASESERRKLQGRIARLMSEH